MTTTPAQIHEALNRAGFTDFEEDISPLGGGEVNDTYRLVRDGVPIVMRISKDRGLETLKSEAKALKNIHTEGVPGLIYFDEHNKIDGRLWILEEYVEGVNTERLNLSQFRSLGELLAAVHSNVSDAPKVRLHDQFLDVCKLFGDEQFLRQHPNRALRGLLNDAFDEFSDVQPQYDSIQPSLTHSDATPSNILVDGDKVRLIDWEFSKYSDPMCDFSTVYYEDIVYNQGKWRIKITEPEKQALFEGYEAGGGEIDEERIKFWIRFDKLGAAVFLYWRINESDRETSGTSLDQYKLDLTNLLTSLLSAYK